jgi:two-component system sensor histidine kinase EvgS
MPTDSRLKILVADDNRMVLATVCHMLTALAYDVQQAEHGLEALRRFEQEPFDLVLTDIQMPYMDGWELTRRVKSLVPGMHVIAMTGMSPAEVPVTLGKAGPDRILFKPLRIDEFENAMAMAFAARHLKTAERQRYDVNSFKPVSNREQRLKGC